MMREAKFRVWDEDAQEMIYEVGITPEGIPYSIPDNAEACDQFNYYPSCHKMQYTGLKDENGLMIYEGDVVKFKSVYYENKIMKAVVKFNGSLGSFVFDRGDDLGPWRMEASMREIEVIGNVYQNPELLEAAE